MCIIWMAGLQRCCVGQVVEKADTGVGECGRGTRDRCVWDRLCKEQQGNDFQASETCPQDSL